MVADYAEYLIFLPFVYQSMCNAKTETFHFKFNLLPIGNVVTLQDINF